MLRRMRVKIIMVSMTALIILLSAIFAATNIYMNQIALKDTDGFLNNVINNNGYMEKAPDDGGFRPPGSGYKVHGVSVKVSESGQIREVLFNNQIIPDALLQKYVSEITDTIRGTEHIPNTSYRNNYRYSGKILEDGFLIVIADESIQDKLLSQLIVISIGISLVSLAILFVFIVIASKYITRPVEEAMDKQKRFISDSSHELKTPLSIMSANLDMLEMEIGSNLRITAIAQGIKRMNKLIQELLVLARTEQKSITFRPFDLSNVMQSTILPLEVIAYEDGKVIELDIENKVVLNGDEEGIRKMLGALMENAIKYSRADTVIKADLRTKNDHIIIQVFNQGIGVTKEQKSMLFDKFYRVDDSRHRDTGGHGIGLSIVKNIVNMHGGKIHVESVPNEYITFKITLHK